MIKQFLIFCVLSFLFSCSVPPKYITQFPGWSRQNKRRYIELENKLKTNPNDINALLEQGSILDDMTFYDSALVKYNKILKINPNFAQVYCNLGKTYVSLKEYEVAITNFGKALGIDSTHALTYLNLGRLYGNIGNKEKQLWCYRNAIKYDSDNPMHYYNLACYYSLEADLGQSLYYLEESFKKGFDLIDYMKQDRDLNKLRIAEEYKRLLQKYGLY